MLKDNNIGNNSKTKTQSCSNQAFRKFFKEEGKEENNGCNGVPKTNQIYKSCPANL